MDYILCIPLSSFCFYLKKHYVRNFHFGRAGLISGSNKQTNNKQQQQLTEPTTLDPSTVVCSVTWPVNSGVAEGDRILINTSPPLLCKSSCSNANQVHVHGKSRVLYQSKVTRSLAAIQRPGHRASNCKMVYFWNTPGFRNPSEIQKQTILCRQFNLVPRSLVDEAEGEIWPNPICIT